MNINYKVIARRWRPQTFEDIVGQRHFVTTIINAIKANKIANAYLFSGVRGVGKTSAARILAKALNCENGPTVIPCNKCSFCNDISLSKSLDVLEIDGASNTHVEDIKDLRDSLKFATSAGKNRIIIIDEIHMLSKSAFNALLKTLEEPPVNVIFIFATTEKIKIPDTIISRCQSFEFRRLREVDISEQIKRILKKEGTGIEDEAVDLIVKRAEGSMRDALTSLDQIISFCGDNLIRVQDVKDILGVLGPEFIDSLVSKILERDISGVIESVGYIVNNGYDVKICSVDLMENVKNRMVTALGKGNLNIDKNIIKLDMIFNFLAKAEQEIKIVSRPDIAFEMAIIRSCLTENYLNISNIISQNRETYQDKATYETVSPGKKNSINSTNYDNIKSQNDRWNLLCSKIMKEKPALASFLPKSSVKRWQDNVLFIGFSKSNKFYYDNIKENENINYIENKLKELFGSGYKLEVNLSEDNKEANSNLNKENILKDTIEIFNGTLLEK